MYAGYVQCLIFSHMTVKPPPAVVGFVIDSCPYLV